MRNEFCNSLVEISKDPDFVFLTGDLGFKALEPLKVAAQSRFINAGVAEQNMVSVGAGLARSGFKPWVYSIAPFMYARPFEQIRNDVCLHDLPVKMVGNGGGYGYGVMGATHHSLEDYGALLGLPHMHVFVPAFNEDVPAIIRKMAGFNHPAYLRLGLGEKPPEEHWPEYSPWRKLTEGNGPTVLVVGPLVGGIWSAVRTLSPLTRPNLWVLSELPLEEVPDQFWKDVRSSDHLIAVEEHVEHGGVGAIIAHQLLLLGSAPRKFSHLAAKGYLSGLYGSQKFHRQESGIDPRSIIAIWEI